MELITDRQERIQILVDTAKSFRQAPADRISKPYPEENRVPGCESEAFAWTSLERGGLVFEFAVENPQGISAMAMAEILREGLMGEPASAAESVPDDIVYRIFGKELSMGKSMGLMGMVQLIKAQARRL
jgi:cysteine desulfuration protein SufE